MKYVVWVCVFMAYLLICVGLLILINNTVKGLEVESKVEITIRGEAVLIDQMVEFSHIPVIKLVFGTLGLLIAMGVPYISANALISTWGNDYEGKLNLTLRLIRIGVFLVFFVGFSFLFNVRTIFDLWELNGYAYMAATCAGSHFVSALICNHPALKGKISQSSGNEVTA